jgi:hypothetical protein
VPAVLLPEDELVALRPEAERVITHRQGGLASCLAGCLAGRTCFQGGRPLRAGAAPAWGVLLRRRKRSSKAADRAAPAGHAAPALPFCCTRRAPQHTNRLPKALSPHTPPRVAALSRLQGH